MITQKTASDIWHAYREITVAENLLKDMAAEMKSGGCEPNSPTLRDAFGRRRHLQLGVPSGDDAHRIFQVSPSLAESVIRAHIANKQAELAEANERARIELDVANAEKATA